MPNPRKGTCTVCRHPERVRMEDLRTSGVSLDVLAERFGIAKSILHRHWKSHVSADRKLAFLVGPGTMQQLKERAAEEGLTVLDSLRVLRSVLMSQVVAQGEAGAPIPLATVSGRLLDVLREVGRLTGEIAERAAPTTNISVSIVNTPGFASLQDGLLTIARAHPAARADIVALLRGLDGSAATRPEPLLIQHEAAHA